MPNNDVLLCHTAALSDRSNGKAAQVDSQIVLHDVDVEISDMTQRK